MFTRSLSHERVVRAAHFDARFHLSACKMLSRWCDMRHKNKEDVRQTRAARVVVSNWIQVWSPGGTGRQ
jgi:hypothetical protein